jgi:hypothetical protein
MTGPEIHLYAGERLEVTAGPYGGSLTTIEIEALTNCVFRVSDEAQDLSITRWCLDGQTEEWRVCIS